MLGYLTKVFSPVKAASAAESLDIVLRKSTDLIKISVTPTKPTMKIFPVDRMFLECFINKAYGALVHSGADKQWALAKSLEWKTMNHPRKVIPDILKYVNIQLEEMEEFRYVE